MKKVLISILIILLLILTYFIIMKDISLAGWKNKNINDIKNLNNKLDAQIDIAKQLNNQDYPQIITEIEQSIENLKITKEKYESKLNYISEDVELGVIEIKEYKIERLWIALENYAKDEGIQLKLDILDTETEGVYDIDVTAVGDYISITDFIYDIEKDDTLGFKIYNFKLVPNTNVTSSNNDEENPNTKNNQETENKEQEENVTTVDIQKLKATFRIEDVGVEFN